MNYACPASRPAIVLTTAEAQAKTETMNHLPVTNQNQCVFVVNFNYLCALGVLGGLNMKSFMQNKPNFQNDKMNVNPLIQSTMNYEQ